MKKKFPNVAYNLINVWNIALPKDTKIKTLRVLLLGSVSALLEVGVIVSIIPIVGITLGDKKYLDYLASLSLSFEVKDSLLYFLIAFSMLVTISIFLRMISLGSFISYSFKIGDEINKKMYLGILNLPARVADGLNPAEYTDALTLKTSSLVNNVIIQLLYSVNSVLLIVIACVTVAIVNPFVLIFIFVTYLFYYYIVLGLTKKYLRRLSDVIGKGSKRVAELVQYAFYYKRDIQISNSSELMYERFSIEDAEFRNAQYKSSLVANIPKIILEGLGILVIMALTGKYAFDGNDKVGAISFLAFITVITTKLLPLFQQLYSAINSIRQHESIIQEFVDFLSKHAQVNVREIEQKTLEVYEQFETINLSNINFREGNNLLLDSLSLTINRGEWIGLLGESGSGKSTFLDVLMGLAQIESGKILVDNIEVDIFQNDRWLRLFSYVPQQVKMMDSNIASNIMLFSSSDTPIEDLIDLCCITDFYSTTEPQNCMKLSGGQKQRVGIARALNMRRPILVLDEATSALDQYTRKTLYKNLKAIPGLTVIEVTHSNFNLEIYDRIIKF